VTKETIYRPKRALVKAKETYYRPKRALVKAKEPK
jgi:hypothetical protein